MTNGASRPALDSFLVSQCTLLTDRIRRSKKDGEITVLRGMLTAYASTLFYLRTGKDRRVAVASFEQFMRELDGKTEGAAGKSLRPAQGRSAN